MRRVEPTSPASAALRRGDIVLSFDGTDIANDGTVPFRSGERISFSYLVSRKYVGDQARPRVLSAMGLHISCMRAAGARGRASIATEHPHHFTQDACVLQRVSAEHYVED